MPLDQANWQLTLTAADRTAQAFNSAQQRMKSLDTASKATTTAMSTGFGAASRALAPLAAAFSAAAIAQRIWAAGMKAADLGEQAEQIGLTTDQLQAYQFVAAQAGVSAEQMDAAMMKLARAMGTANEGSDEMIARFEKLGVKLLDSDKQLRKASDVMPEVARGLLAIGSETERSALMQELFGRSGARLVTILEEIAQGNEKVVNKAKAANAVIGGETIKVWDELQNKLIESEKRADTLFATLAKPIASAGIDAINYKLLQMTALMKGAEAAGKWLFGPSSTESYTKQAAEIQSRINDLHRLPEGTSKAAMLQQEYEQLEQINRKIADQMTAAYTMPAITVTATKDTGGVAQPTGRKAAADALTEANKRLAESQQKMNELVDRSAKEFNDAQEMIVRYGDGATYAAAQMEKITELMPFLEKHPEALARMLKDVSDKAAEVDSNLRRAQGGITGFAEGFDKAMAEMGKANDAFAQGTMTVNLLSDTISDLMRGAEVDFGQIAASWVAMLAEMEMKLALSTLWQSFGGLGGLLGGGGGGGGGGLISGLLSAGAGLLGFAEGGRPAPGIPYIVGEHGPEIRVDGPGSIYNRDQIAGMGGGNTTVVVNQTIHIGEYVTTQQYTAGLRMVERSARQGAQSALIDSRRRGGLKDIFK